MSARIHEYKSPNYRAGYGLRNAEFKTKEIVLEISQITKFWLKSGRNPGNMNNVYVSKIICIESQWNGAGRLMPTPKF